MKFIEFLIKGGKAVPVLNKAQRHEDVWGSGCVDPRFLDLGTSWRRMVSFTPQPLYPQGKSPGYPLNRRVNVAQLTPYLPPSCYGPNLGQGVVLNVLSALFVRSSVMDHNPDK
jgi:hypothetical protein